MSDFVIYIEDDWSVDEIETVDDCDEAFEVLVYAIASIEYQLDMESIEPSARSDEPTWERRARAALRLKKAAFSIIQYKRGAIERRRKEADRKQVLEFFALIVKRDEPKRFKEWISDASRRAEMLSTERAEERAA